MTKKHKILIVGHLTLFVICILTGCVLAEITNNLTLAMIIGIPLAILFCIITFIMEAKYITKIQEKKEE